MKKLIIIIIFSGINLVAAQSASGGTETGEPEALKAPEFSYKGDRYRSPFSELPVRRARAKSAVKSSRLIDPENLKVTGIFSGPEGKMVLLSGDGVYYVVKNSRIYNEDAEELPGAAAIVKKDKLIIITDEDTLFELKIPE